jgi:hypothetical protein
MLVPLTMPLTWNPCISGLTLGAASGWEAAASRLAALRSEPAFPAAEKLIWGWDGMGWVEGDFPTRNGIELPGTRNIANFAGGKCGLRIFGKSLGCLWPPTIRGLTWGTSTLSPKLPWVSTTLGSHRGSFRPTYIWPIYTKSHRFVRSCRCIFSFDFLKLLSC